VYSVSHVAISGQVIEKVVMEAREHPDEQIVGVLVGGQSGGSIVVEDAVTGPSETDATKATLTGDSIARIADDIINKRIRGSIVGWYHSHVRGGVFMSEMDVETQLKLQQFSPLVTAMVIDTQTGQSGFFRADAATKESIPVPSQNVDTAITTPASTPYVVEQAMYPQAPTAPGPAPISIRTILLVVILITLAVVGGIAALAYYRPLSGGGTLAVAHNPPRPPFTIGNPITFDANVTGSNLLNVTLSYKIIESAPQQGGVIIGGLVSVPMLLKAACSTSSTCTYSYTLPASDVSGLNIQYYISVFDTVSPPNIVRTDVQSLDVGDFNWHDDKTEVTALRQSSASVPQTSVSLALDSIHSFNDPVSIRIVTAPPLAVRVVPASTQVRPPNPAVLTISSTDKAQIVSKYDIEVDAVYAVHAVQIIRSTTLELTLTDIDIDVEPTYAKTLRCSSSYSCNETTNYASYTVTLSVYDGFTSPSGITLSPTGLPNYAYYRILLLDNKIALDGTQTLTYRLEVRATTSAKVDKYLFSMVVRAGNVIRSQDNIQFEIVD
jgi:proteasome lid subunit RPN8/RPN11